MKRLCGRNFSGYAVVGSLAVIVFSCASAPKQIDSIAEARAAIERVESMPLAGEVAAKEIDAAHASLREAETLARKNKSGKDIANAAYLAKRHAEIAEQQVSVENAKRSVDAAEKERQAVLLRAREEEAARKADEADAATREAEAANRRIELLRQELSELNAKKTERGLVLTLGDVLFDTAKATLKPGAVPAIDRLAKFLSESPEHSVMIEGHTDSVGTDEYNQQLSQRRADAVREALVSRGVTGDRVKAVGKGEGYPVAGNDSSGGRQQNRRVEIIIEDPENRSAATIRQ